MVAAILGASVDTRVLPPIVHAMIAYGAIACNVAALKTEIAALADVQRRRRRGQSPDRARDRPVLELSGVSKTTEPCVRCGSPR